jgi:hypothetical protein
LAQRRSAAAIAALGFAVALVGDACHVASGTTRYEWDALPEIWRSRAWFPFLVAGAVLLAAWMGRRADLPARERDGRDIVIGTAAVLALYALTAALRGQPATVSVVLCGAIAAGVWAWWDPSSSAFVIAAGAAVAGPLAEIVLVSLDAASYAPDSDDLAGVAPWLPCLYFAAGAVASGLWAPMERALRDLDPRGERLDSADPHG